jgi:PEP-CTERM motif
MVAILASPASAVTINVTVSSIDENNVEVTKSGEFEAVDNGNGIFEYSLDDLPSDIGSTGRWDITEWSGSLNPDPVISHSFNVTNLLAGTQSFTITVSTVTGPIGAPTTLTGGSAQGGVTDTNGNGATLSTSGGGNAFYTSLLDGAAFVGLYADPSSASAGAFLSANLSPLEDFGSPIPSFPGPAVANSIGIRFQFVLTSMDRATGSGVFVVEPIPEPSTATLAGMALLGLAAFAWRWRKR